LQKGRPWCMANKPPKIENDYCQTFRPTSTQNNDLIEVVDNFFLESEPEKPKPRPVIIHRAAKPYKTMVSDDELRYLREVLSCPTCRFDDKDAMQKERPWCKAPNPPEIEDDYCQTFEAADGRKSGFIPVPAKKDEFFEDRDKEIQEIEPKKPTRRPSAIHRAAKPFKSILSDDELKYMREVLSCPTCRFDNETALQKGRPWCKAAKSPKIENDYCKTFEPKK